MEVGVSRGAISCRAKWNKQINDRTDKSAGCRDSKYEDRRSDNNHGRYFPESVIRNQPKRWKAPDQSGEFCDWQQKSRSFGSRDDCDRETHHYERVDHKRNDHSDLNGQRIHCRNASV